MRLEDLPAVSGVPTVTAARMARADRIATLELGVPKVALMENAARQVATVARLMLGGVAGRRIVALAGRGNNGGDALAAVRLLHGWGADARAIIAHDPQRMRPLAREQATTLEKIGVRVARSDTADEELVAADLVLDGLLGYSGSGAPREDIAPLIRAANRSRAPILAIDLPSGLHPDSGEPQGVAIRAAVTVTLALPKVGLIVTSSPSLVGELVLADIGIPAAAHERADLDVARLFGESDLVRVVR